METVKNELMVLEPQKDMLLNLLSKLRYIEPDLTIESALVDSFLKLLDNAF